jgi:hypothetical protein
VPRKETRLNKPNIVRFLISDPLIMREMAKHVPDTCFYAPVTVLIDERYASPPAFGNSQKNATTRKKRARREVGLLPRAAPPLTFDAKMAALK